jgi:hypothetical protein
MTIRQQEAVRQGIRSIHADNQDRASVQNGVGFNKFDTRAGERLATTDHWSPGDFGVGFTLVRKYRSQLPRDLFDILTGVPTFLKASKDAGEDAG